MFVEYLKYLGVILSVRVCIAKINLILNWVPPQFSQFYRPRNKLRD